MLHGEAITNTFIGKNGSSQVTHDLMHLDQHPPSLLRVKSQRLYTRVYLTPLLRPVSADLAGAPDKTAFKRPRPSHVRRHEGESSVNVPRVEGRVGGAEQFDLW